MDRAPSIAAIVLAAGGGSRFVGGTHKLLAMLPARGRRPEEAVVERALGVAVESEIGPVLAVAGAVALEPVVERLDAGDRLSIVANPHWRQGQATSLAAGIHAARRLGVGAVVVGLGDQPGITPGAWRTVAAGRHPITVATYAGRRGNPVRLASEVWPLLPTEGDAGARTLMHVRPDLVGQVACEGSAADIGAPDIDATDNDPTDIDTVEDLERWQKS